MTGLDKMKEQILNEAKSSAADMIAQTEEEARSITAQAAKEAQADGEKISQKSEADVAAYKERVASSIDLLRKKAILKAKQEVITEVLDGAYDKLLSQGDAEYFTMIEKMLEKSVLGQDGEIYFSTKDLGRMPADFESKISKIAEAKGGKLTLGNEGRHIEGGFVLVYGGIEENCTLKAMLRSAKDDLSDKVNKLLFN